MKTLCVLLGDTALVLGGFAHKNSSASPVANQAKVRLEAVSSSNDLGRGDGFSGQGGNGIHPGDESDNHSSVLCGAAGNVMAFTLMTGVKLV